MNEIFVWLIMTIAVVIIGIGIFIVLHKKKRFTQEETEKIKILWAEIDSLQKNHPEQAILKADKLLDYALTKLRFEGSLGEKLKKAAPIFSDINGVWKAHKLRNTIAHEVDARLKPDMTAHALNVYRKAFQDLGLKL